MDRHDDESNFADQTNVVQADLLEITKTDTQIQILEGSLSKQHARFDIDGARVTLTDLGATNGTKVNGETLIVAIDFN